MMEILARLVMGRGGARPPAFTIFTITNKFVEYAPAERADRYTPRIASLPLYVLCGVHYPVELVCSYVAVL